MKTLKNKTEIFDFLKNYRIQKWALTFKNYDINLNIFPEKYFLEVFNKIVVTQKSINLSIIDQNNKSEIKELIKSFKKYQKTEPFSKTFIEDKSVEILSDTTKNDKSIKRAYSVIEQVFSDAFILDSNLTEAKLQKDIEAIIFPDIKDIKKDEALPVYRLEEKRSDCRIVLWISPIDYDIKLCFALDSVYGILNPVTEYYETYFELDNYHKFAKIHNLSFFEMQGYDKYPKAKNNTQVFSVTFKCYRVKGPVLDIFADSGTSQRRFLDKLLQYLYINIGLDIYGKGLIDKNLEYENIPVMAPAHLQTKPVATYTGRRVYSTPQYDVILGFMPVKQMDDFDNEFSVTAASITVHPFETGEKPPFRGWVHHPLVYEADK